MADGVLLRRRPVRSRSRGTLTRRGWYVGGRRGAHPGGGGTTPVRRSVVRRAVVCGAVVRRAGRVGRTPGGKLARRGAEPEAVLGAGGARLLVPLTARPRRRRSDGRLGGPGRRGLWRGGGRRDGRPGVRAASGRGGVGRTGVGPRQVERGRRRRGRTLDPGEERGRLFLAVVAGAFPGVAAGHRGTVADCNAVESSNAGTLTVETRSTYPSW
ncbi:hypothetical protein GA0070215_102166 [Micromonospora marina]|uniref:Uncharacterized protein n=1 Tax=Micromonospora marina TaxID=307120 RepID=A0A1C4UUA6_9ACTN|nr:hypothetical protein GA0070215_102166 [Micromonospora marina]